MENSGQFAQHTLVSENSVPNNSQNQEHLKSLAVLYVEDDENAFTQSIQFLSRYCGTLITARNGAEGLKFFCIHRPHIVITDIQMPVMDGLTMARKIRDLDMSTAIIVLTAFEQSDYLMRAIDIGIDKYVTKPVMHNQLLHSLFACAHRLKVEMQLLESEERFRHLFYNSPDAHTLSCDGIIIDCNKAAEELLRCNRKKICGQKAERFFPELQPDGRLSADTEAERIAEAIATGKSTFEWMHRRPDGSLFWTDVSLCIITMQGQKVVYSSWRDMSERKQTEKTILELKQFTHATLDGQSAHICVVNTQSQIIFTNRAWNTYARGNDVTPDTFCTFCISVEHLNACRTPAEEDQADRGSFRAGLGGVLDGTLTEFACEYPCRSPEGVRWYDCKINPFSVNGVRYAVIAYDEITENKRLIDELRIAKEHAEAATRAKSIFLSSMSHEIRTPMNGVIGMTNLLMETVLTPEQQDFAEIVRKSAENLLGLVNDIMDFSKIEAGKLDLEILNFDLHCTIEDTAELLSQRAVEKGLEIICRIDPLVPSHLKGDAGRVRQIITNLAGNSIKFTQEGEIVISASLMEDQKRSATILFEVQDTGIGIPFDRCDAIFAPYTQVDDSTTRKYGGTGLGLTICRQLAELMGGEIGVTSEYGKGSTFWFTLCFEKQPEQNIPDITLADISGIRILVIDGKATNRTLMATLLGYWGCRCETAADGEEGLELLHEAAHRNDPFQVALLTQNMPGVDGVELGRRIKADNLPASPHIILMKTISQRENAAMLEQAGFSGYLTKPVRQLQLHNCIAQVLGIINGTTVLQQQAAPCLIAMKTADHRSRILLVEDNIINQKVALRILSSLGYEIDVAANGLEALQALARINYDLVLMDCQMPEMDGFEATATIRNSISNVRNHAIPIIAMTANVMNDDREHCLQSGMDDYLSKPVKKENLAAMLERWL